MLRLLVIIVLLALLFKNRSSFSQTNVDDIINYKMGASDLEFKKHISNINNISKDVALEDVGCFTNLYEKFFLRKINPFNTRKDFDSGISVSMKNMDEDFNKVIELVKTNGFESFANSFKNDYSNDYSKTPLLKIAALALFAGYSYISISKFDENTINEIYMTYSPPMERHNIVGNFNQEEYSKYLSSSDLNISDCGYSCGKYKCGSIGYPTIKSSSKYAVYRIIEKI
jgi:hypothetical protein